MKENARLGVLIALATILVGNFVTSAEEGFGLLPVWIAIGAAVGAAVALALSRSQRAHQDLPKSKRSGRTTGNNPVAGKRTTTEETPAAAPPEPRFYALSRKPSSSELRALMVDAPALPGNPMASRLQLIVERYDAYAKIPMSEGSLLDYSLWKIQEQAKAQASDRAPVSAEDLHFALIYFRSEGPLDKAGRCAAGWTFVFMDGAIGIRCEATVTANEMMLIYRTGVSYPAVGEAVRLSPKKALEAVHARFPQSVELNLHFRANLPSDYHFFSRSPLTLFSVDEEGELIAPDLLPSIEPATELKTGISTVDALTKLVNRSDEDSDQHSKLRQGLVDNDEKTLRALASDLLDSRGPGAVEELRSAIAHRSERGDRCTPLIHVLARVPSTLSMIALHRLSNELDEEHQALALSLFDRRRRLELQIFPDPVEQLDFEEARALLGKSGCERVSLISTYDPEADLLPVLQKIGLRATRVRRLSGDTEIFLAAYMRTTDG
ncbi:MAG: hypothetical protein KC561_10880, partial [Myxococcales bacterium]|nr:hypothetical protein [Myxococcales bacterium]